MTRTAHSSAPDGLAAAPFSSRYELGELLGRGGMACVYRAIDRSSLRIVALKQLTVDASAPQRASVAALFEREFQTLMQLRHPHVIEVYDYGMSEDGSPFYTMELLDGGDLRELAPMSWQEACRISFGVCSALALLHSRRLLHRDVSPRNIRCTQRGVAKLIDFGAMAPMSDGGADVVGTPAFTAPETLQRLALDARTDLYSLGATLYYALTARLPYAARTFSELLDAWRVKPVPPSALDSDIPPALDDLVLALISVEPALRPQSAFDVMQRLAAYAGLQATETEAVSRAYLSTPSLVGRDEILAQLRDKLRDSQLQRGAAAVMLEGAPGAGRSRLLDSCALEAQMRGFTLLRATASGSQETFAVARALTNHLLDALPHQNLSSNFPELFADANAVANDTSLAPVPPLRSFSDPAIARAQLQRALRHFWTSVSRTHPLLIAVDDVHKIDEPSAALLAELIDKTKRAGILIALTSDSEADASSPALHALSRRCTRLPLTALTHEQTRALFGSLFGDVANLGLLVDEIHQVALGNPRQTLALAQHLVDRGLIRYISGSWTLPSELAADDLPRSTAAAMHARIARLSPRARFLAEAQALAFYETLSVQDYQSLVPLASSGEIELALTELETAQALVRDGASYRLANRVWISALLAALDPKNAQLCHRALAAMYAAQLSFAAVHHAFSCGMAEEGLSWLDRRNEMYRTEADYTRLVQENVGKMAWCYPHAIAAAQTLGRSKRAVHDLRRWYFLAGVVSQAAVDPESTGLWFEQLAHDSGLALYRSDSDHSNPGERLMRALGTAQQRYLAAPEAERVYPVDEAIRKLGEYVVILIAVGSRTYDIKLLASLPGVLEPFVALSPLLDAIWQNAIATSDMSFARYERACERWRETIAKLDKLTGSDETFVNGMRNAIAYAIGMAEAQLGLATAADWAKRLDDDPFQRVSALELRRIVRLDHGDAAGAERLRKQSEVLALQQRAPQMFKLLLILELAACASSGDLTGVVNVTEQLKPLAAQLPNWHAPLLLAEASFHVVRGDYEAAMPKLDRCSELLSFDEQGQSPWLVVWIAAQAGLAECLFGLGRYEEARSQASSALQTCEPRDVGALSFELVRTLALAECKLGDTQAAERLDELIARQNALGTTGLRLGMSYEARALVAVWTADAPAFERFAELTAREYRHGAQTTLAARYERLINEAARCGMHTRISLTDFAAMVTAEPSSMRRDSLFSVVSRNMIGSRGSDERTRLALQMVCTAHAASIGHLYLITPEGTELRASLGADEPPPQLAQSVTAYVSDKRQLADELDDMLTGELRDDDALTSLIKAASSSYELLPLSCVVDSVSTLVGVVAIAVKQTLVRNERQAQLLNAIATSLLQAGDSPGLRLSV